MEKISIITVVRNGESTIGQCISSVLEQTTLPFEYIIIDGNSVDRTLDVIKGYSSPVIKVISEPDNGIYDAMNKGLALATGDIIGILNSDDYYSDVNSLCKVICEFSSQDIDVLWGNMYFVSEKDTTKIVRTWKSSSYILGAFAKGWHPPHPTFFVKKTVYDMYGYFDLSFEVSADFELMLRFIERYQVNGQYLNEFLVKMRMGGESTGKLRNIIKGNLNVMRAFKKNGISVSFYYPLLRFLPKLKQLL